MIDLKYYDYSSYLALYKIENGKEILIEKFDGYNRFANMFYYIEDNFNHARLYCGNKI